MKFVPVESSNIAAIAHDPSTAEMQVRFHSDAIYAYSNVPSVVFDEIRGAASVGRTFNQLVKQKPAEYPIRRVQ